MSRVLVLDDEEAIRMISHRILARAGFKVYTAETSEEALFFLRHANIDLLIQDIVRPGLDGQALFRLLKRDRTLRKIPVLCCSGYSDRGREFKGGHMYLPKPFSLPSLVRAVRYLLEEYCRPVPPQQPRKGSPPRPSG